MHTSPMAQRWYSLVALALLLTVGCRGTGDAPKQSVDAGPSMGAESAAREPSTPRTSSGKRRWTSTFSERRLLLAEEIYIEGPPGLLEHVATRLDPEVHSEEVKMTAKGLRQSYTVKPAFLNVAEPIACFLDELEAHALRKIVVLERPGLIPVRVVARGDVYLKEFSSGKESREASFALEGKLDLEETPKPVGAPLEQP